jgi:hypothetical protein
MVLNFALFFVSRVSGKHTKRDGALNGDTLALNFKKKKSLLFGDY